MSSYRTFFLREVFHRIRKWFRGLNTASRVATER